MTGATAVSLLAATGAILGAIVGSFLNVVVHRLPRLIDAAETRLSFPAFLAGLSSPPSHCPCCRHRLAWRDNIPIAAYLLRRGRCRHCDASYGGRYLVVEIATAMLFACFIAAFGLTAKALLGVTFVAGLIALSFIDFEEQLLPDVLLLPLFPLGLLFQAVYGAGPTGALLGAGAGYGALWLIRRLYLACRNVEGLGRGDIKLAGVIGAWVGLPSLPFALLVAFAAGTLISLPAVLAGRADKRTPVPFGPFLALGALGATFFPALPAAIFG